MTFDSFSTLGVAEPLQRALAAEQYVTPTPIQAQAIPQLLAGKDVLGIAQTGTGKTAAFALPILQRLAATREAPAARSVRALILAPTRELAVQIGTSFRTYGRHLGLRHAVILGGVGMQPQIDALRRGVDILVATPGRLLDLLGQGHVRLDRVSVFVLDEADRMLDMGFVRDVRKIAAAVPRARQTLLFSATMPTEIARLAQELLHQPVRIEVTPPARTVDRIDQQVYFVNGAAKRDLLVRLLGDRALSRVVVFTRTKRGANRVAELLAKAGIGADAIHGNKSQGARQRALEAFRSGRARVLVATDIAARGIDIDGITHVVNFELPNEPESYVHRIGRTARAGADGVAISFCDPAERDYLRAIERLTKRPLTVAGGQAAATNDSRPPAGRPAPNQGAARQPQQRWRRRFHRGRGRQAA
jgi:ATP-dependent RNA helicase RhlE